MPRALDVSHGILDGGEQRRRQLGAGQVGHAEIAGIDDGVTQIGFAEIGPAESAPSQIGLIEPCISKSRLAQGSEIEPRPLEVCASQVRVVEAGARQSNALLAARE
jgi:hypothetical protein